MGKEIVYCGDCGKSIREEEFEKGKAQTIQNRPFCSDCRPVQKPAPPIRSSSAKLPVPPPPPSTRRLRSTLPASTSRTPWIIGACLVGAALVVLLLMMGGGGGRNLPEPQPPTPPISSPDAAAERASAVRDLEAFAASSSDPEAILKRCDAAKGILRGTPLESRLRAVEERAKQKLLERERDQKLRMALDNIQQIRSADAGFDRHEEVGRLLKAALDIAGPRKAEVEKLKADYERDRAAFVAAPPPPPPTPPPAPAASELGPFPLGAAGAVDRWLVLGPFGNKKDPEGLYEHPLLNNGSQYVPSLGKEERTREGTTVRWIATTAVDGKISFHAIDSFGLASRTQDPAIAFGACWMEAESELEFKLRVRAETGFQLWIDEKLAGHRKNKAGFADPEEVLRVKLSPGFHPVLIKIASIGGAFGFSLRAVTLSNEKLGGLRIWNRPPGVKKMLFSENFNQGPGRFVGGEVVDGGPDGTKALSLPKTGAWVEGALSIPVTSATVLRFKIKPLFQITQMEIISWVAKSGNHWYHLRGLKPNEWNAVEVRLAEARVGWKMDGPSLEGEVPANLKFYFDDGAADARVLIDDVEIVESDMIK